MRHSSSTRSDTPVMNLFIMSLGFFSMFVAYLDKKSELQTILLNTQTSLLEDYKLVQHSHPHFPRKEHIKESKHKSPMIANNKS